MTPSFDEDLSFLKEHTEVIVLGEDDGPRVAVVPAWQGRAVTSTVGGKRAGFGWINRELVATGEFQPHINVFGGEDRFWLGPEGGQFSIFFKGGDAFDLEHWQTPAAIDTVPYAVVAQSEREVTFRHQACVTNYSGTDFDIQIDRAIRLLDEERIAELLGLEKLGSVDFVAFETENTLTNTGANAWTHESGALSIWILGMFRHSDETTVVVPYRPGPESELGPIVNDTYFGKVPADRLRVGEQAIFFKGDGKYRSKIGVPPGRALPVLGSYDEAGRVLTITQYTLPQGVTEYVNSMWELQEHPFGGDVVNSYNDGPSEPGAKPLGPFYELETSSPAAFLASGESLTHYHRTFHFSGNEKQLDAICRAVLGVSLDEIDDAFGDWDQSGTTDEYVWVFEISGSVPPAHLVGGWAGAIGERQPEVYFRLGAARSEA